MMRPHPSSKLSPALAPFAERKTRRKRLSASALAFKLTSAVLRSPKLVDDEDSFGSHLVPSLKQSFRRLRATVGTADRQQPRQALGHQSNARSPNNE